MLEATATMRQEMMATSNTNSDHSPHGVLNYSSTNGHCIFFCNVCSFSQNCTYWNLKYIKKFVMFICYGSSGIYYHVNLGFNSIIV
jgi:hypothetical protein